MSDLTYPADATLLPAPEPPTFTERNPVVIKVTAGTAFLSALLVAAAQWVHFTDQQMSALSAVVMTGGALVIAFRAQRNTTPWAPIEQDALHSPDPDQISDLLDVLHGNPGPLDDIADQPTPPVVPTATWRQIVLDAEVQDPGL